LTAEILPYFTRGFVVTLLTFPLLLTTELEFVVGAVEIFEDFDSCVSVVDSDKGMEPPDGSASFDVLSPIELLT
jgi:hypothetical protein